MRDTDDWTRRHARVDRTGDDEQSEGGRRRVVSVEPPADDWSARHAWCRRS